jgi:hypothetical protein
LKRGASKYSYTRINTIAGSSRGRGVESDVLQYYQYAYMAMPGRGNRPQQWENPNPKEYK